MYLRSRFLKGRQLALVTPSCRRTVAAALQADCLQSAISPKIQPPKTLKKGRCFKSNLCQNASKSKLKRSGHLPGGFWRALGGFWAVLGSKRPLG